MFTKRILAYLLGVVSIFATNSYAAEQRCTELGTNCLCSEPLNTNSLVYSSPYYNPADSTTKECDGFDAIPGKAIVRPNGGLLTTNDAMIMGALPAGHTNTYVVRGPEGHL